MDQENEDADEPLICQVAEDDKESREAVMKSVLEKVALGTDEDVAEETAEVFAELQYVENFHLKSNVYYFGDILVLTIGISFATQPCWHESCFPKDPVSPERADQIVDAGIAPLDQSIASLLFGLWLDVSFVRDIVFRADIVKVVMNQPIEDLYQGINTEKTTAKGRP